MVKKKKHDKDKYYQLARQQGYRARSAFKLIQLNKKYDFLSTARVCIDLCAAPGGWCQVAAKYMPASSIILGIDLLPIRPIRNVKTYVCDITTAECRQIIRKELQTWQADVVLCDGAPNVGAEYSKDAFVQNELSLAALKLAVDVLGPHGTFVSKVFRSADYNALLWVFKQLFKKVSATKPLSSRNESAEIFVVCEDYLAPSSIDPKLLDPKYVFQQLEDKGTKAINIFHPKYGVQRRFREGYDESLGQTLRKVQTVGEFIECKDPVQVLSEATELSFGPDDSLYLQHKDTTNEIRICLKDLKVLGKPEFKMILKWRLKLREYRESLLKAAREAEGGEKGDLEEEKKAEREEEEVDPEEELQNEIRELKEKALAKKKKDKKRVRERMAKERMRADLGMKNESIELPEHDKIFSLAATAASRADIEGLAEVSLDRVNDPTEDISSEEEDMMVSQGETEDEDDEDEEERAVKLERDLEEMYSQYQQRNSSQPQKEPGSKAKKRSKIAKLALAGEAAAEDAALYDGDKESYIKLLAKDEDSDDSDSEVDEKNPLLVDPLTPTADSNEVVTSRWFSSNPLFKEVEEEEQILKKQMSALKRGSAEGDRDEGRRKRQKKTEATSEEEWSDDDDGDKLPSITKIKTEKEKRKEKRKMAMEKNAKKEEKRRKMMDIDFDITAPQESLLAKKKAVQTHDPEEKEETAEQKKRKALIRAGMGRAAREEEEQQQQSKEGGEKGVSFEVVEGREVMDDRQYDSDNEFYDAEDYARTLAIGTMMLNKTKAKELVDASYNRFTWNDDDSLPSWFVDDEEKHYKAQVPIPKALMDKMREKFLSLATKPIKKVAEAKMRKKRKLLKKMKAAKKKAEEIANMQEMTTREKAKAIEKAMKNTKNTGKKSKVFVVAKKGGRASTVGAAGKKAKGAKVKFVDSRMKKDLRAQKRAESKKKGGKRGKRK